MNLRLIQIIVYATPICIGFLLAGCSSSSKIQAPANSHQPNDASSNSAKASGKPTLTKAERQAKARIDSAIRKGVSIGGSSSQVAAWLRSEDMEVQRIKKVTFNRHDYKAVIQRNGYQPADLGGIIVSFRRVIVEKSLFSAPIVFFFDKEDKLIKFNVEAIWLYASNVPAKDRANVAH